MKIIALESSAITASVAVAEDETLLAQSFQNSGLTHSATLMPMVADLLKNTGLTLDEMDVVAVAAGPGSFTGVRIGVACAKGLAMPNDTPCCGVSTLECIAYGGAGLVGSVICAVMDARCGQVYNALFRVAPEGLVRLTKDRALSIEELGRECREYGEGLVLFGDGAELCHREFTDWGARLAPESLRFQRAASAALLAGGRQWTSAGGLAPAYLRMPQAERELKAKRNNKEDGT